MGCDWPHGIGMSKSSKGRTMVYSRPYHHLLIRSTVICIYSLVVSRCCLSTPFPSSPSFRPSSDSGTSGWREMAWGRQISAHREIASIESSEGKRGGKGAGDVSLSLEALCEFTVVMQAREQQLVISQLSLEWEEGKGWGDVCLSTWNWTWRESIRWQLWGLSYWGKEQDLHRIFPSRPPLFGDGMSGSPSVMYTHGLEREGRRKGRYQGTRRSRGHIHCCIQILVVGW